MIHFWFFINVREAHIATARLRHRNVAESHTATQATPASQRTLRVHRSPHGPGHQNFSAPPAASWLMLSSNQFTIS